MHVVSRREGAARTVRNAVRSLRRVENVGLLIFFVTTHIIVIMMSSFTTNPSSLKRACAGAHHSELYGTYHPCAMLHVHCTYKYVVLSQRRQQQIRIQCSTKLSSHGKKYVKYSSRPGKDNRHCMRYLHIRCPYI